MHSPAELATGLASEIRIRTLERPSAHGLIVINQVGYNDMEGAHSFSSCFQRSTLSPSKRENVLEQSLVEPTEEED